MVPYAKVSIYPSNYLLGGRGGLDRILIRQNVGLCDSPSAADEDTYEGDEDEDEHPGHTRHHVDHPIF